jgi:hypothetical protein
VNTTLLVVTIVFGALATLFLFGGASALRRGRLSGAVARTVLALLALAVAALAATISIATQGYKALTREEVAAVVLTRSTGDARFEAVFLFPDGRRETYELSGEELYVDAHILKWKPIVNVLGLHTAYELDRVAGRFPDLADEQATSRTVFSLSTEKPIDMFTLRQRYALLSPLLDAEYGSATFIPANREAEFELLVSTSGLLIRERPKSTR